MGGVVRAVGSILGFGGGGGQQTVVQPAPAPTPAAAPAPQTDSASMTHESTNAVKKKRRGKQQLMVQPQSNTISSTGLNL